MLNWQYGKYRTIFLYFQKQRNKVLVNWVNPQQKPRVRKLVLPHFFTWDQLLMGKFALFSPPSPQEQILSHKPGHVA